MLLLKGFCPICETVTEYRADDDWYRDHLNCSNCPGGSLPRERALALVLNELRPDWRNLSIHESSSADRGISLKLSTYAPGYVGTQYFPMHPTGKFLGAYRNEDLENLTFSDDAFDVTITLDVMEHVYRPEKAFREIHRTLKPGGVYICTFPIRKEQTQALDRRFELDIDGQRVDFKEPEFHGNPISEEGAIVTIDWGYDLHQKIAEWTPFDVRVYRFFDLKHGIIGEHTEVIVCQKASSLPENSSADLPHDFDSEMYHRLNPDVAAAGIPADQHWLEYGRFERRPWRDRRIITY